MPDIVLLRPAAKAKEGLTPRYPVSDLFEACQKICYHGWTYQQVVDHFGFTVPQSRFCNSQATFT